MEIALKLTRNLRDKEKTLHTLLRQFGDACDFVGFGRLRAVKYLVNVVFGKKRLKRLYPAPVICLIRLDSSGTTAENTPAMR